MTDAQTEARAIARGWTGSLVELEEAIATAFAAKNAELAVLRAELNDCASEIHELRTQLAAVRDDAMKADYQLCSMEFERDEARAQLAEARKALDELREELACEIEERIRHLGDDMDDTGAARVADLRRVLSALEPAATCKLSLQIAAEARQDAEPVAWQWRAYEDGGAVTDWHNWDWGDRRGWEALAKRDPGKYEVRSRPLFTRPAEQAVTEAMVEAAAKSMWPSVSPTWEEAFNSPPSSHNGYQVVHCLRKARAALKAAMEAGRHD